MLRLFIEETNKYEYTDSFNRTWMYEKFYKSPMLMESNWSRLNRHINNACFFNLCLSWRERCHY